ncbi:MAG: divalent-cation tolerance protein CutA [Desulfofustis sp.]|nr:divalent-cation tolerance protein CutA [Desulfofustis sp.]NNF46329.1 divalent-cation tolerance protein CutA [Desulfofustis sp.]
MKDLEPIVVSTSVDNEDAARSIAELVLGKRLAACVHIHPPMTSLYWWKGEITSDSEYLLSMKSDRNLFNRLVEAIRSVHPYEVPEIIATDVVDVDREYSAWMREELDHG